MRVTPTALYIRPQPWNQYQQDTMQFVSLLVVSLGVTPSEHST